MLYKYDDGRLDKIISAGDKDKGTDLHSLNAKACGISRGDAKPLWLNKPDHLAEKLAITNELNSEKLLLLS